MRIRNYRQVDIPTLVHIQQLSAKADGTDAMSTADFEEWFAQPELEAEFNAFVITDDDDELNEWGQGGTLEGVEGEIVGYTVLQLRQSHRFLCQGTVHPQHRRRGAGRALLICALNRARIWSAEIEFEAEQEERPIYFEALLPLSDPDSKKLAAKCDMQPVDERVLQGMQLYRCEL